MPPSKALLNQSESKGRLFEHLDMDEANEKHGQLYAPMEVTLLRTTSCKTIPSANRDRLVEAVEGRQILHLAIEGSTDFLGFIV